jgi:histidyl-tRNA synthetase
MTDFWTTADGIPALPGAYVLAINLSELVVVSIGRKPSAPLAPGCYLYCGSAKGPGGLAARLARHMRHGKAIRWHVDNLTEAGTVLGAWTFPGSDECDLVAALSHLPVPIEGFGSTDCRRCRSHLLRWPDTARALFRTGLPVMPIKLNTYGSASHRRQSLE